MYNISNNMHPSRPSASRQVLSVRLGFGLNIMRSYQQSQISANIGGGMDSRGVTSGISIITDACVQRNDMARI